MGSLVINGCSFKREDPEPDYSPRIINREGGVFKFQLVNDPLDLDPATFNFQSTDARQLMFLLYRGLVDYDPETMKPIPAIADSWEISEDGLIYTFILNKEVKFHNGKEVTAEALKQSWERLLRADKKYVNSFVLENVVGAKEKLAGQAQEVSGVRVLDNYRLEVELKTPNSSFLSLLGHPATFPVDIEEVETAGDKYGKHNGGVIGTGPFQMVEWQQGKQLVLEKNDDYFGHEAYIERLEMPIIPDNEEALVLLEAGKLHFIQEVPLGKLSYVENNEQLSPLIIKSPLLASYYYSFNINKPPLDNEKIRQALNYAVDREMLIEHLWEGIGTPLGGAVPEGFAKYNYPTNRYTHNTSMAQKLLEDAGYPMGFGLPDLVLTYNDVAGHGIIAQAIQQQLAQIGVKVVLEEVTWEKLLDKMKKQDGDMFRSGWLADYPDVDSFLYSSFYSEAVEKGNYLKYSNSMVDDLLMQGRSQLNSEKRQDTYALAESYIIDDAPKLWLFSYEKIVMRGDYVQGLTIDSLGVAQLEQVWIEQISE